LWPDSWILRRGIHGVFLITGDLGFGVLTDFAERFPRQYLNVGVAEQNMVGIATGLALEGRIVFTYSIANFGTLRCLEQIRNDACYHNANVKVVSMGGGFSYGALGISHHATEDISILRALPDITVVVPGDRGRPARPLRRWQSPRARATCGLTSLVPLRRQGRVRNSDWGNRAGSVTVATSR